MQINNKYKSAAKIFQALVPTALKRCKTETSISLQAQMLTLNKAQS